MAIEKVKLDREKIKEFLNGTDDELKQKEEYFALKAGISYPTYWRRMKLGWKPLEAISLGVVLGEIVGSKNPIPVDAIKED